MTGDRDLIGNIIFLPMLKLTLLRIIFFILFFFTNYVRHHKLPCFLIRDFTVSGFDWNCGLLSSNCHYYTKLKGDMIYSPLHLFRWFKSTWLSWQWQHLAWPCLFLWILLASRFILLNTVSCNLIFSLILLSFVELCELDVLNNSVVFFFKYRNVLTFVDR